MRESSRPGVGRRSRGGVCARLVVLAVACACGGQAAAASAAPVAFAAAANRAYVLTQRSAGSVSQLVLAPTGLRFSFSAGVRAGERSRARKMRPFVGIIIRYSGERLTLLDPIHRTYQTLALASAIHSYDAELRVLAKAQPSTELPPAPGTAKAAAGQEKLTAPAARLTSLRRYERIGPVRARAYLLRQGTLQERIWYAAALPGPPKSVRGLLVQALGSSGSGSLGRVLRAHASQIPLRIDERAGKKWRSVLRTTSIVRRRLTASTLARPHGYRSTGLDSLGLVGDERADVIDRERSKAVVGKCGQQPLAAIDLVPGPGAFLEVGAAAGEPPVPVVTEGLDGMYDLAALDLLDQPPAGVQRGALT